MAKEYTFKDFKEAGCFDEVYRLDALQQRIKRQTTWTAQQILECTELTLHDKLWLILGCKIMTARQEFEFILTCVATALARYNTLYPDDHTIHDAWNWFVQLKPDEQSVKQIKSRRKQLRQHIRTVYGQPASCAAMTVYYAMELSPGLTAHYVAQSDTEEQARQLKWLLNQIPNFPS